MKVEERVKLVRNKEFEFIGTLMASGMAHMTKDDGIRKMLSEFSGTDITKNSDLVELSKLIDDIMPRIEESKAYYDKIVGSMNTAPNDNVIVQTLLNNGADFSEKNIKEAIKIARDNKQVLDTFFGLYDYIITISNMHSGISAEEAPVALFKKYAKLNKNVVALAKETMVNEKQTIYDAAKSIYDDFLTPELAELMSVVTLRQEIEAEQAEMPVVKKSEVETPVYELANAEKLAIEEDISNLQKIEIAQDDMFEILAKKEHYDGMFTSSFIQIDDKTLIEMAREYLAEIAQMIEMLKQKIAAALEYAGIDIKDILREEHSYQIRDYVQKLRGMSDKYSKMLGELDKNDASQLVSAYNKALSMYAVVDEMKANSFVVDVARFSK